MKNILEFKIWKN